MSTRSFEDLLSDAGGPLNLLRSHIYDRVGIRPDLSPPQVVPHGPR